MVGENTFLKEGNSSDIVCYSNANWAGYKAQVRSISGYCMFHGDNLAASRRMWWVDPVQSQYLEMPNIAQELLRLNNL